MAAPMNGTGQWTISMVIFTKRKKFVNKVAEYMVEDKTVQEIFDEKLYRNLSIL